MLVDKASAIISFALLHTHLSRSSLVLLVLSSTSLLLWRLWRFSVSPWLYPEKVKELPYWIPIIGHTISFYRNGAALADAGVLVGNSLEPFAVQLLGVKNYYITKPSDINRAFRNITTLSWDGHIDEHLVCIGVKRTDLNALNKNMISTGEFRPNPATEPNEQKNTKDFIAWAYRRQLAVDKINEISSSYFRFLQAGSTWSNLRRKSITVSDTTVRLTVRGLLDCTLSSSITRMMFGAHIFEIEPEVTTICQAYVDGLWRLVYHYPMFLSRDFARNYERMMATLEKFKDAPASEKTDASWLLNTVMDSQKYAGMEKRSDAAMLCIVYLAAIANVHATSYWLLIYIIFDSDLRRALQEETLPAFQDGIYDVDYVVHNCPLLESAFREVLRLHITSYAARHVDAPTTFGDKVLEPGANLLIPFRQLNHSQHVWGNDHHKFDASRFLNNKELVNHTTFRPFGGGSNLCPGKAYAYRMVLGYIAYILHDFDVELPIIQGQNQSFPVTDNDTLIFGVAVPKPGTDPVIELRPSQKQKIKHVKAPVNA